MSETIVGKIDVTKVTKARLFQGKNGAKYLDIVLIPVTNSKYGDDFMICESVTQEERKRGIKGPILGNARYPVRGNRSETSAPREEGPGDVPF